MQAKVVFSLLSWIFWIYTSDGRIIRSLKCDFVCPKNNNPVCARCQEGQRSFSNPCMIRREYECYRTRCAIESHGICGENNNNCDTDCTTSPINPFCAKDGDSYMTFNNTCQLEKQNRCAKQNYVKVYDGYCTTNMKK